MALDIWGIPPPIEYLEYRKSSCLYAIFYTHIHGFLRRNINMIIISPKSLTHTPSHWCMCSSVLSASLVVSGSGNPTVMFDCPRNWCYFPKEEKSWHNWPGSLICESLDQWGVVSYSFPQIMFIA